ncbi:MAG: hypothetical protein IJW73_08745 [Candidatus Gastranaerophilales bacterium]|nr:hypothetical protein [Candidatus Gastranaerophilales bacterium]MBQ7880474.1 hypothetical protein [Clostridia bacterium]
MAEVKVYLFTEGSKGLIGNIISDNQNKSMDYAKYRKQRIETIINVMSKYVSKKELDDFKRKAESLSDDEFDAICKKVDAMTDIVYGNNGHSK